MLRLLGVMSSGFRRRPPGPPTCDYLRRNPSPAHLPRFPIPSLAGHFSVRRQTPIPSRARECPRRLARVLRPEPGVRARHRGLMGKSAGSSVRVTCDQYRIWIRRNLSVESRCLSGMTGGDAYSSCRVFLPDLIRTVLVERRSSSNPSPGVSFVEPRARAGGRSAWPELALARWRARHRGRRCAPLW